jgi:DNA repair exonuclease SbcCD nuclease subunit
MKLLHFADLHLDTPFAWASRDLARQRRRALRATLTRICALASELGADAITCGGDLYEQERFTPDTASFLRHTFAELHPMPVFIAPGNHDWFGPKSLYHEVDWTPNVQVFTEPELKPITLEDGLTLWGAAHCAPANTPDFLRSFVTERTGVNIALFHGSEHSELPFQEEGKAPHAPFRGSEIRTAQLQHVLLGHFHTPRDAPDYTYPGNPDPLTFGEKGERAAVLVTLDESGSVTRERHKVAQSVVHDVTVDLSGIVHSTQVPERVTAALAGLTGVVRVTLTGEVGSDVDVYPADAAVDAADLDAVVIRLGQLTVAYDFEALAEERTVRGQFVRKVREAADLSESQRRRVLVTGLRALAGRANELEVN